MRTEIAKWGNSLAVRLPKRIIEQAGLTEGAAIELAVESGAVVLRPARPRYTIDELLAGMTPENQHESFDDGPVGHELI
ncbi:AbrB/MazE/SpoVT family DNA-binding domain-containing protein (plasmid) [Skermanella rosea]|uniref:AbrB/MazE/SpoVT family DNA-binding domain-containing protein n=1 Tax=Skermanella rosea TaxID=1817965 RepID=UPI001933F662|nr:AbrB/MazE/SpoVT family DNA-binding domain-containing protein [Skermanella rosea]UEM07560.1 AbrB/MazE/SpoVT family DNA-binding domain-containing protein [Skermanella rosea]